MTVVVSPTRHNNTATLLNQRVKVLGEPTTTTSSAWTETSSGRVDETHDAVTVFTENTRFGADRGSGDVQLGRSNVNPVLMDRSLERADV